MTKPIDISKIVDTSQRLTGKYRFRTNWFGKIILQVEYSITDYDPTGSTTRTNWRDAKVEDLTLLEPKD